MKLFYFLIAIIPAIIKIAQIKPKGSKYGME